MSMADFTYLSGSSGASGCHYPNAQSLDFDFDNAQSIAHELHIQQQINQAHLLSPTTHHQRHDSLFGTSPATTPKLGVSPQQRQAEPQPYVTTAQMTPHGYPQRPVNMSRSESQYSNTSSGHRQQQRIRQHRASFSNGSQPGGVDMSRSSTQYSAASIRQQQHQAAPQPRSSQRQSDLASDFPLDLTSTSAPDPTHCFPGTTNDISMVYDFGQNDISETQWIASSLSSRHEPQFKRASNMSKMFDGTCTTSKILGAPAITSPSFRPPSESIGQHVHHDDVLPATTSPAINTTSTTYIHTVSPSPHSPPEPSLSPPSLPPRRRRRRSSPSTTTPSDPIIGHVTTNGKFKCLNSDCLDLIFGRQADFRRHYDNVHAPCKKEYFCSVEGCSRSRNPMVGVGKGKSKGRSFGQRKDKMEEHVRTVHGGKGKRKRGLGDEAVGEDERDRDEEESFDEGIRERKRGRY